MSWAQTSDAIMAARTHADRTAILHFFWDVRRAEAIDEASEGIRNSVGAPSMLGRGTLRDMVDELARLTDEQTQETQRLHALRALRDRNR